MQPLAIEVEDLVRRFGKTIVLDHVSLGIRRGEFFSLLGPSGCGKTTLLRILGGLDLPDAGTVRICGREAHGFSAEERPVKMVFQTYALFPHLTVWDNVAFGLRMKRLPKAEIKRRVQRILDLVQISTLSDRKPPQLSGGQKQRVATARAIVNEPQILLLDEPLGALDLKLRKELQIELRNLQRQLGITFVFVTHDQEEALVLSDRIAVMRAGRIEQLGGAEELYERPRTRFVAQFLGTCNVFDATVRQAAATGFFTETVFGELRVNLGLPTPPAHGRHQIALAIRPEKVQLRLPGQSTCENQIKARVEQLTYNGAETQYLLRSGGQQIKACTLNANVRNHGFDVGNELAICLPPESLIVLED
ncbi:MAG: ABC transporter ATP-binding protein [Chloroflexi bacterium]|nr:ABC transporter ATP-binding protein [Chloroflexota bacterium]